MQQTTGGQNGQSGRAQAAAQTAGAEGAAAVSEGEYTLIMPQTCRISPRAAIGMEAAGIRVLDATVETQKEAVRLRINGKKPDPSERKRKMHVEAALRTAIRLAKAPDARLAVVTGSADPFLGAMLWGSVTALAAMIPPPLVRRTFFVPCADVFLLAATVEAVFTPLDALRILRALF